MLDMGNTEIKGNGIEQYGYSTEKSEK